MVVVVERGDELVRLAAVEAVPAVEAAAERPGRPRVGHVGLALRAEVPLPHGVRRVPGGAEDLGEEAVLAGRAAPVPREARGEVGHPAHATAVMVPAREQAGPGGRAQCGGVEVGQPRPLRRPDRRSPASRCRTRSTRAGRSRRRRGRSARRSARRSGGVGTGGHHGSESRQSLPIFPWNSTGGTRHPPNSRRRREHGRIEGFRNSRASARWTRPVDGPRPPTARTRA